MTQNSDALIPMPGTNWRFYAAAAPLLLIVLAGALAYARQVREGIGVAGIGGQVMWGFYITNFAFWSGVSRAGILISASLRLLDIEWRRPLTRSAEALTLIALGIGALFPLIHLGRPGLFYWLIPYPGERMLRPNFNSPLVWDFLGINAFLALSVLYFWTGLLPDLALLRDRSTGLRRRVYGIASLGWKGSTEKRRSLEAALRLLSLIVIPLTIAVETIVSFIFATTLNPGWRSSLLAPAFIIGAIYAGTSGLIIVMAAMRRLMNLERYWKPLHFDRLSVLLLLLSATWFYLTLVENFLIWRRGEPAELAVLMSKLTGRFALLFWGMVVLCAVVPWLLLGVRRLRTVAGAVVASCGAAAGMWLERFLLIVPTLAQPRQSFIRGAYSPSWVEIAITAGTVACFALACMLFAKFLPVISIWEMSPTRDRIEP